MRSRSFVSSFGCAVSALAAVGSTSTGVFASSPTFSNRLTLDGGANALGAAIATTDTMAVVSAPETPASGGARSTGTVVVYSAASGSWTGTTVVAPDAIDGGNFGTSVATSGGLIAVGAAGTPPAASVFSADAGSYTAMHTWADPASDLNASFGSSIAVFSGPSLNYVAIAAPESGTDAGGRVYVARQSGSGAWSDPPVAISGVLGTAFGISVAFAGDGELLVGAPGQGSSGTVFRYAMLADGGIQAEGSLVGSMDGGTQQFGNSIATYDNFAIVTAPPASSGGGAAFVFAYADGGWQQQATLTGGPTETFANFGASMSANFIAVGSAIDSASSTTGLVDVWSPGAKVGEWTPAPSLQLAGDAFFGQAIGWVGETLFIGDPNTSGMGTATSALYVEDVTDAAVDAASEPDASPNAPDATSGADAALGTDAHPVEDAYLIPPSHDAAAVTDGSVPTDAGAGSSSAPSGAKPNGCSCGVAGRRREDGSFAGLLLLALAGLVTRRRRSTTAAS